MAAIMDRKPPDIQWRRTWPDVSHDFIAGRGGRMIARVYRHTDGQRWQWFDQITGAQGIEQTRAAAVARFADPQP